MYSQNFPSDVGQANPYFVEYDGTRYPPNGIIYPDGQLLRAIPDGIIQPVISTDSNGIKTYSQRSSMPSVEKLLNSLPSPNLITPLGPIVTPPLFSPIAPVPQNIAGAPLVSAPQNFLPPSPLNANIISPDQYNSGSQLPCSQVTQAPKFFIAALPNPNIIHCNHQPPIPMPSNQYISNAYPIESCQQSPPNVPPTTQFTPGIINTNNGVPITQIQVLPTSPPNLPVQNLIDIGSIPFNSISIPSTQRGLGVQFIPNPNIPAPFSQIDILPPALPPYTDMKFATLPFYPNPNTPPILPPQPYTLTAQFMPDTCNSVPSPVFLPPPLTPNYISLPQEPAYQTIYPNQQVLLPPYSFSDNQPYTQNIVIPPQFPIHTLPIVVPPKPMQLPMSSEETLPINLQINLPAANVPPPSITIISTIPPNSPQAIRDTSDSVSLPYNFDNCIPFPTYSSPPIIIQGSKSKHKKWIPILIALFANRGCNNGCSGGCCCSSGNNIPIPFPIAIPTNNPIIVNKKKSSSKHNTDDYNDEMIEDQV